MTNQVTAKNVEGVDLLRKLAWSFTTTTGIEFNELFSVALLGYCEAKLNWNPEKETKFTTWLYTNVKNSLINFCKKENHVFVDTIEIEESISYSTYTNPYWELRELFSPDGQYVADKITNDPHRYLGKPPKMIRGQLVKELRAENWVWQRIWDVFDEIKLTLKNN